MVCLQLPEGVDLVVKTFSQSEKGPAKQNVVPPLVTEPPNTQAAAPPPPAANSLGLTDTDSSGAAVGRRLM